MSRFGFTKNKSENGLILTSKSTQISVSEFLIILGWLIGFSFLIVFNFTENINSYFYIVNSLGSITLIISLLVIINERKAKYELELRANNLIIRKRGIFKSKIYDLKKESIKRVYLKKIGFPKFFEEVPFYTIVRSFFSLWTLKIPAIDFKGDKSEILFCNNISWKNRKWIVETLNYYLDN